MFWELLAGMTFILIVYLYSQNHLHKIIKYRLYLGQNHSKMQGKKIVLLSDLHFKESTSLAFLDRVIVDIERLMPDIVIFSGDLIHTQNQEKLLEQTKDFFYELNKTAPTYVSFGDQDLASEQLTEIKRVLKLSGTRVLCNEAKWHSFGDTAAGFWLMGLCEPVANLNRKENPLSSISLPADRKNDLKILIAHHPEYFERYLEDEKKRPNLILSGHTLGGQVVLPMVGGLYTSNQGLNPTYDFGVFTSYKYPDSRMIITSGLSNANFPLRVNNRPEIVLIELK